MCVCVCGGGGYWVLTIDISFTLMYICSLYTVPNKGNQSNHQAFSKNEIFGKPKPLFANLNTLSRGIIGIGYLLGLH